MALLFLSWFWYDWRILNYIVYKPTVGFGVFGSNHRFACRVLNLFSGVPRNRTTFLGDLLIFLESSGHLSFGNLRSGGFGKHRQHKF